MEIMVVPMAVSDDWIFRTPKQDKVKTTLATHQAQRVSESIIRLKQATGVIVKRREVITIERKTQRILAAMHRANRTDKGGRP